MRKMFVLSAMLVTALTVQAAPVPAQKGTPPVKSISALAFGPNGTLFIGDSQSATIFAVSTNDTAAAGTSDVMLEKLGDKLGSALGTTAANVAVADMKVNPASGNIFLAVTRGKGKDATPVIVRLDRAKGTLAEFPMTDVTFSSIQIPNASDRQRALSITSMAFLDGKLIVAGLSNEEFASTLRAIAYPFQPAEKGTAIEIYHGAHGALETRAPVRTFVPYKVNDQDQILAAYTCTPLVRVPVSDLKTGEKVKGTTIAELGNRNNPLDMIVYTKDKTDYLLMANSARGVMKIPTAEFGSTAPISSRVSDKAGPKYDTIKELTGVTQLDKLDAGRALVLIDNKESGMTLKSVPLP